MDNNNFRARLRLRGKSIGQVDKELIEIYSKVHPFENATVMFCGMIESEILHRQIASSKDLDYAEQLVKNLHYKNIGEYLEDHMRRSLENHFTICQNCRNNSDKYCSLHKRAVHEWDTCDECKLR